MKRYWFYVKKRVRKNGFYENVCLSSVVCLTSDDTITLDRIKVTHTSFGPKKMDEFVNQPFLSNVSGFIHKKQLCRNKKFNFPAKIYKTRQKCQETKFIISKRSTNLVLSIFSYKLYLLFINGKYY